MCLCYSSAVIKQWDEVAELEQLCLDVPDSASFLSTAHVHYMEREKCEQNLEEVSDAVTCLCSSSWKVIERGGLETRLCLLSRLSELLSSFPKGVHPWCYGARNVL